jgi:hypothetical protein
MFTFNSGNFSIFHIYIFPPKELTLLYAYTSCETFINENEINLQNNFFHTRLTLFVFFQVRDLVAKCTCPTQFPMIRVSEGKYRIGDTKVLIFVRVSVLRGRHLEIFELEHNRGGVCLHTRSQVCF